MGARPRPKTTVSPLSSAAVMTFVATIDAKKSRTFYEKMLGLSFVEENPFALVFDLAGTMLRIQKVEKLTPAQFTVLGWEVNSIGAAVHELSERGVKFEHFPGMRQDKACIWQSPSGAKIAWFKDPDGNTLSLTQFPK